MPSAAEPLFEQGLQAAREGRHEAALAAFDAVLEREPGHLGALVSRGSALARLRRPAEAEAAYRRALEASPAQSLAFRNLCVVLADAERHAEALALAERALAADPQFREAAVAKGNALTGLGRADEALAVFDGLARQDPASAEAQQKLGLALAAVGRRREALAALDRAVAITPEEPLTRLRRATLRLQTGDFAGGWDDYEHRHGVSQRDVQATGLIAPALTGALATPLTRADVAGRRVLLIGEQGVGDQMMFASVIPDLLATGAKVTCVCDARLVRLFQNSFPEVLFAAPETAQIRRSEVDTVAAIGSLGGLFRRAAADFPGRPYLRPSPGAAAGWRERLGPPPTGLRIGLSWRGGMATTRRAMRSMPLEALTPILSLPDCEFVSLQYGEAASEAAGAALPVPIRSFPQAATHDFDDLAGLVSALDVVVSVQTSLVHLCGGLGAPCLVALPQIAEWRYGTEGEAMPWYGSVRLFRQAVAGDWQGPLAAILHNLQAHVSARPRP